MEQTLFNPDMESISASDQEKLEKSLLLDQIEYVYGHSKMYQDKFSKAGITKDKIKDVKDLALLPFTTKQELRHSQKRLAPFGDFPFGVGNSRQLIQVIKDAGINAISSTPSYPRHLEKIIKLEFNMEPAELGLKLGLFGGEPGLENPVYRERIETTWGMKAQNSNYGVSDVLCNFASVCLDNYKLHFLGQGALLVQLIDPLTLKDIPMTQGAVGEMVLTHLKKEAQPLVRYRTSDLMEILETGPCECGRTGFRFRIVGRADDMLHVKGINVFPNGIAMVLEDMVPEVTGEFQITLNHPSPYTGLDITVEHGIHVTPDKMIDLKLKIEKKIKETLNFTGIIELVKPDSIERSTMGKAKRVIHNY